MLTRLSVFQKTTLTHKWPCTLQHSNFNIYQNHSLNWRRYSNIEVTDSVKPSFQTEKIKKKVTLVYKVTKEKRRIERLIAERGTPIYLPPQVSTKLLSSILGVPSVDLVKVMIKLDIPPSSTNELLPPEVVDILVMEYDRIPNRKVSDDRDLRPRPQPSPDDDFPKRPATVVILGHVNHGKTTLLDALRNTKIKLVDGEAGGITQHIGAFSVPVGNSSITFLDTPGHAAFEKMRERGAHIADIAILVVDAERGVQAQTLTSIKYLNTYNIPTIVAMNKIDKQSARPNTTCTQLMEAGLELEQKGGNVPVVKISALHEHGIEELKETLLLLAELLDLKADRNGPAEVVILETRVVKNKGVVSSGIVRCGTLKPNQMFVAGMIIGKVRWIFSASGEKIKEAFPGYPIEFTGYKDKDHIPNPGDIAIVVDSEFRAREAVAVRNNIDQVNFQTHQTTSQDKITQLELEKSWKLYAIANEINPDSYIRHMLSEQEKRKIKEVPVYIKGDVSGSIEAVKDLIELLPKDDLIVRVVRCGIGAVTESDIKYACDDVEKVIILGFDVPVPDTIRVLADSMKVIVQTFTVIYTLMDWIRNYCTKRLPPKITYIPNATCLIQEVFEIKIKSEKIKIAGCRVLKGTVNRGADVHVHRDTDDQIIYRGKIRQLKHGKQDVKTVSSGFECGIMLTDNFGDFQEGDHIFCVERKETARVFDPQS